MPVAFSMAANFVGPLPLVCDTVAEQIPDVFRVLVEICWVGRELTSRHEILIDLDWLIAKMRSPGSLNFKLFFYFGGELSTGYVPFAPRWFEMCFLVFFVYWYPFYYVGERRQRSLPPARSLHIYLSLSCEIGWTTITLPSLTKDPRRLPFRSQEVQVLRVKLR